MKFKAPLHSVSRLNCSLERWKCVALKLWCKGKIHSLHTFPFYFISSQWSFHTIKIREKYQRYQIWFLAQRVRSIWNWHEWRFSRRGLHIRFPNFSEIATATAFSESKCFGIGFSVELPLARFHLKTYISFLHSFVDFLFSLFFILNIMNAESLCCS